jgi:hypothetical protein
MQNNNEEKIATNLREYIMLSVVCLVFSIFEFHGGWTWPLQCMFLTSSVVCFYAWIISLLPD